MSRAKRLSKNEKSRLRATVKMEFNYSRNILEGFVNSSNTTTQSMSVEETFKWTNAEITRLIQIIFRPILVIVGTIGNCLTVYIMRRTSLKYLSTCFYMVSFGSSK